MNLLLRSLTRLPAPLRRGLSRLPGANRLRRRMWKLPAAPGPGPGEPRAVVYLPTWARWDAMRQRPQYLVEAFAAHGHPAYFVDEAAGAPRTEHGVHVVPDLSHVPGRDVILYVHFAPLRTAFDVFTDPVVVYDILDDLTIYEPDEEGLPEERTVRHHHPRLMERADVVIASSPALMERHRAEREDLLLVPNGADAARFGAPAPRPADLPAADPERPLVGFHGALGEWIDFDLVAAVAAELPGWQFVFVGPVLERGAAGARRLAELPNVALIGERPSESMPGYVQAFDVAWIPFLVNHLTEAVGPLKLYETLAAGIPCVTTPLPVAVAEPAVRTAAGAQEVAGALAAARPTRWEPSFMKEAAATAAAAGWDTRIVPLLERLEAGPGRRVPSR